MDYFKRAKFYCQCCSPFRRNREERKVPGLSKLRRSKLRQQLLKDLKDL